MSIMSGLFFFFINFYVTQSVYAEQTALKNAGQAYSFPLVGSIAAALMFAMQIVALPFYRKMIAKRGKTFTYRFGSVIWILTALSLFLIPPDVPAWIIYIVAAVMGFGISGPGLVPHTMFGDVVDLGQLKFGERPDGKMGGFTNFVNQVAQAVGVAAAMFIIGLFGFTEQDPRLPDIGSQPAGAMTAVKCIMALAPLILMGLGALISLRYRIDKTRQERIAAAIAGADDESVTEGL